MNTINVVILMLVCSPKRKKSGSMTYSPVDYTFIFLINYIIILKQHFMTNQTLGNEFLGGSGTDLGYVRSIFNTIHRWLSTRHYNIILSSSTCMYKMFKYTLIIHAEPSNYQASDRECFSMLYHHRIHY